MKLTRMLTAGCPFDTHVCSTTHRRYASVVRHRSRHCLISSGLLLRGAKWHATDLSSHPDRHRHFAVNPANKRLRYRTVSSQTCKQPASHCDSQLQHVEWLFQQSNSVCQRQEYLKHNNLSALHDFMVKLAQRAGDLLFDASNSSWSVTNNFTIYAAPVNSSTIDRRGKTLPSNPRAYSRRKL